MGKICLLVFSRVTACVVHLLWEAETGRGRKGLTLRIGLDTNNRPTPILPTVPFVNRHHRHHHRRRLSLSNDQVSQRGEGHKAESQP